MLVSFRRSAIWLDPSAGAALLPQDCLDLRPELRLVTAARFLALAGVGASALDVSTASSGGVGLALFGVRAGRSADETGVSSAVDSPTASASPDRACAAVGSPSASASPDLAAAIRCSSAVATVLRARSRCSTGVSTLPVARLGTDTRHWVTHARAIRGKLDGSLPRLGLSRLVC